MEGVRPAGAGARRGAGPEPRTTIVTSRRRAEPAALAGRCRTGSSSARALAARSRSPRLARPASSSAATSSDRAEQTARASRRHRRRPAREEPAEITARRPSHQRSPRQNRRRDATERSRRDDGQDGDRSRNRADDREPAAKPSKSRAAFVPARIRVGPGRGRDVPRPASTAATPRLPADDEDRAHRAPPRASSSPKGSYRWMSSSRRSAPRRPNRRPTRSSRSFAEAHPATLSSDGQRAEGSTSATSRSAAARPSSSSR